MSHETGKGSVLIKFLIKVAFVCHTYPQNLTHAVDQERMRPVHDFHLLWSMRRQSQLFCDVLYITVVHNDMHIHEQFLWYS